MCDYLIRDGIVLDGAGSPPVEAHIGIRADRIVYIGSDEVQARETVDARGLVVSPGFIDTHAHSEFTLVADGRAEGRLSQGVTTEISGNCGLSAAPMRGEALERRLPDLEEFGIRQRWTTFGEYFSILQAQGIAINTATLCGQGNLRGSVLGYGDSVADAGALHRMKVLLAESLRDGAIGLSTGLIYPPGVYSATGELIELARVVSGDRVAAFSGHDNGRANLHTSKSGGAGRRFLYATHMRSEGDALLEAIEEALLIGRGAGIPVHISHIKTAGEKNWEKIETVMEMLHRARASGMSVTCDRYPYIASSTDLDTLLPPWVFAGGVEEEMARLKDDYTRRKIAEEMGRRDDAFWERVVISSVSRDENRWTQGEHILFCARKSGKAPLDFVLDLLIGERTRVGAIFFTMNEENLRRFLSLPFCMLGSDSASRCFSGLTVRGKPHPRGFGSFTRFIGHYARDAGLMGLPEAVRKITTLPAQTFGLSGRGRLREGFFADVTVFDPERIIDRATFRTPFTRSDGIAHVFVNGIPALREGVVTGRMAGRILS